MFKVGDKVRRVDGQPFLSGNLVNEITRIEGRKLYFFTKTWLDVDDVVLVSSVTETREELEKAMDVFEKYKLLRAATGNYLVSKADGGSGNWESREELLKHLFPSEKEQKLKELQDKINELQKAANELKETIANDK